MASFDTTTLDQEAHDIDLPALPPGWAWTTIGDIADTTSGGTPSRSRSEYYGGSIPWVKSGEVNRDLISETEEQISELGLKNSSAKVFSKGTVLVALYGATVGRTGVLHIDAATNQAVCALFPLKESFDAKYMMYWIRSERQSLIDLSVGGAQPNISQGVIRAFHFPLAPLAEQRRIVAAIETQLTRLDAGVAALKAAQARLKRYRAAVLKAACEGRLVPQDANDEPANVLLQRIFAERRARWAADLRAKGKDPAKARYEEPAAPDTAGLPELPTGWAWATWRQVGYSQNGRSFPSEYYQSDGIKLLRPGNLYDSGKLVWTDSNTRYMPVSWGEEYPEFIVGPDELVMNLTAQSLKDDFLGRVCLTSAEERCLLNQRLARLTSIEVDKCYLLWMFKSKIFRRYVDTLNTGSLIQHMFTSQLADFVFPLPPLAEQQRIVAEVERRLSVVAALEATVAANMRRATRLRQSILKRAFAGKLVPQDPSDEPARVLLERIRRDRATEGRGDKGTRGRGRPHQPDGVEAGVVPARQANADEAPQGGRKRGRPRKDAPQPTGRTLPVSEPVSETDQLLLNLEG